MTKTLKKIKAKKQLFELFPPNVDPVSVCHKYSDDIFLDILQQVQGLIPFKNLEQNLSLTHFLYAGCLRFDRWFSPSPYIVNPTLYNNFICLSL